MMCDLLLFRKEGYDYQEQLISIEAQSWIFAFSYQFPCLKECQDHSIALKSELD